MSGKPIPEEAVAQVCDRMLTAAIGKDWRKRAPEAVTAFWMGEVREALQEVVPALTAAQQQGQGQGGGEVAAWETEDGRVISARQKATALRDGGASASSVAPYTTPLYRTAPPSAPVGVDAPGSRAWMAEVCRAAALSLAAHGVRNDQLSKVADWIAQQPAAREGAAGMMPRPIVTDAQRCSYRCPYYMDGPVLSLCNLNNERLIYDGSIPPKRTERCKQETGNHDNQD